MNVDYCLRCARRFHGDRPAIHHEDQILTYKDFHHSVDASARRMAAVGIRKGVRVAVLMANSPAYLNLYFSIPLLGALIVPMNYRWHINEMAFTLIDADAEYLFIDQVFAPLAAKLREMVSGLKQILYYAPGDCPAGITDFRTSPPDDAIAFDEPHEDDLVGLFYTSGTTGGPKGAMPRTAISTRTPCTPCCRPRFSIPTHASCTPRPCSTWPTSEPSSPSPC